MKNTKGLMIIALVFTLVSCASIPENTKDNNQPGIRRNFIPTHDQLSSYTGQQVRFSGKATNVINTKSDMLLEIVVSLLNDSAKSQIDTNYQGCILARQKGFLDLVNYRNRFVTILGTIQGGELGLINRIPYNFVKIDLQGIQVWHLTGSVNTTYNMWDYGYGAFRPEPTWETPYCVNTATQATPELVE